MNTLSVVAICGDAIAHVDDYSGPSRRGNAAQHDPRGAVLSVQAFGNFEVIVHLKTAEGARPHRAGRAAGPRRRGDRIEPTPVGHP
jgi:hypothetical protein